MSKKMKRSPFLVGSSGNGIPSLGTFLKYLGLRWEEERRELREQHLNSSQATPAYVTPGTQQLPQLPLWDGFFQPELDGRREEAGLFQTACSLKSFLHKSGGRLQKPPFRYGKQGKEGRKASSPWVEGGECWAAEQSFPCIGLFWKRA